MIAIRLITKRTAHWITSNCQGERINYSPDDSAKMEITIRYERGLIKRHELPYVLLVEKGKVKRNTKRTKALGLPSTLTLKEWPSTLMCFNWGCAFCGKTEEAMTVEHLLPVSEGGGTTQKNCVPACRDCNNKLNTVC